MTIMRLHLGAYSGYCMFDVKSTTSFIIRARSPMKILHEGNFNYFTHPQAGGKCCNHVIKTVTNTYLHAQNH